MVTSSRSREAGISLLEVAIYVSLVAILSVPLIVATTSVSRMSAEGALLSKLLERQRVAFLRLGEDYEISVTGTVVIAGQTLTFAVPGGFDGVGPAAVEVIQYSIQADPDDPTNGADDDGDGVVDENLLVRLNTTTGESAVVLTEVEAASSTFVASGDGVQVTLATVGRTKGAQLTTRLAKAMVFFPRN